MDAVREQAGGDEDERDAGPLEERPQVDDPRSAVEPVPDADSDEEADHRADERAHRLRACGRRLAHQEEGGLDALADDRGEGKRREAEDAAIRRARDRLLREAHP